MMRMMIEKLREIENSMQDYPFLTNRESAVILYKTTQVHIVTTWVIHKGGGVGIYSFKEKGEARVNCF
jgi:hypothetical protein